MSAYEPKVDVDGNCYMDLTMTQISMYIHSNALSMVILQAYH